MRNSLRIAAVVLCFCCHLLLCAKAEATVVRTIDIQGLERIERSAVLNKLAVSFGEEVSDDKIAEFIKKLYSTKFFYKVKITISKAGALEIVVQENPIINEVKLRNVSKNLADSAKQNLSCRSRGAYTKEKVKQDAESLRQFYYTNGRLSAEIVPKLEILSRNRVNVVFEINEGQVSRVDDVIINGNMFLTTKKISSALNLRGKARFASWLSGKVFEENAIDLGKNKIKSLYGMAGFPDMQVAKYLAEYDKETQNFSVTLDILEDERYRFGFVAVKSLVSSIDASKIPAKVFSHLSSDSIYRADAIDRIILALSNYLNDLGYAFPIIEPVTEKDPSLGVMNITFVIKEAIVMYINRINIIGTVRTNDSVIRRELVLREGDLYTRNAVMRSRVRLNMLGYFDAIEIKEKKTEYRDLIDVDVIVKDRDQTGNLSFSVGYSTFETFLLMVGLSKANLFGLGYAGNISTTLSAWRRMVQVGFSDPHFMGTNLSLGFDLMYSNIDPIQLIPSQTLLLPPFLQNSYMAGLRLSYPITDRLFHSWSFRYQYDDMAFKPDMMHSGSIYSSSELYSQAVTGQRQYTILSHSLTYDRRNNPILPTNGFMLSFTQSFALPLPWQQHYISHELYAGFHIPLYSDQWVLNLLGRFGNIFSYDDTGVAFNNRFAVGYYNMRGFYFSGIGPHIAFDYCDVNQEKCYYADGNKDIVPSGTQYMSGTGFRGDNYYVMTTELMMPTPLPREYGLKLLAFMDVGSNWGVSGGVQEAWSQIKNSEGQVIGTKHEYIVDSPLPRVAVGGGILWMSPMGPIRLEFAAAVVSQVYDIPLVVRLHFSALAI